MYAAGTGGRTHPVGEGPGDVFEVVVLEEVGGVEADPGADALDDGGADVGRHVAEAVRADGLEQRRHHRLELLHLPVAICQRALERRHSLAAGLHAEQIIAHLPWHHYCFMLIFALCVLPIFDVLSLHVASIRASGCGDSVIVYKNMQGHHSCRGETQGRCSNCE